MKRIPSRKGRIPLESAREKFSSLGGRDVLSARQRVCKRSLDLAVSVIILILFAPLGIAVALLIKLASPGPVFYSQSRGAQGGRVFTAYKFRTMRVDAPPPAGTMSTKADDPRIYPLGRFLRRWHLDEFPQLWNVIRGDMSLVGPRAEYTRILKAAKRRYPEFAWRERVPAGLTGWAQVHQGHVDRIEDYGIKLEYDLFYILNYSLWMDARVLCRTALVLVRG